MLPPRVYGDDGACLLCQHLPLTESLGMDARQAMLQIEHTAARNKGLCPPASEMASLMGWPLERVEAAVAELAARDLIAPLPKGMRGDFSGQYRAKLAGWQEALARMELRAQIAEQSAVKADEQRAVERELRAEIKRLEGRLTAETLADRKIQKYKQEIQQLQEQLQDTRAMVEAGRGEARV